MDFPLVAELRRQDLSVLHKLAIAMLLFHGYLEMIARLQFGVEVDVVGKGLSQLQCQFVAFVHLVKCLKQRAANSAGNQLAPCVADAIGDADLAELLRKYRGAMAADACPGWTRQVPLQLQY